MNYRLIIILSVLFLFTACSREDHSHLFAPDQSPSEGQLQFGIWEAEPLGVNLPEDGRCNRTSDQMMVETENGYYLSLMNALYYGDRADLGHWSPVCSRPNCSHASESDPFSCDAYGIDTFYWHNGRLYHSGQPENPAYALGADLDVTTRRSAFFASSLPDGTGKQAEFQFQDFDDRSVAGVTSSLHDYITPQYVMRVASFVSADGQTEAVVYVFDADGLHTVFEGIVDEKLRRSTSANLMQGINGDPCYTMPFLEGSTSKVYRLQNLELQGADLQGFPLLGSHLSGNTLRFFRQNEGYYDVDLTTREEVQVAEHQLENSCAEIVQPNCILESTLLSRDSLDIRGQVDVHSFRLFNGQKWLDVALPETLAQATNSQVLTFQTLASDRILMFLWDTAQDPQEGYSRDIYEILLDTETPALEYVGTIAP